MLGALGALVSPVFAPLGFGDAAKCVALVAGMVAKEAVVSTMRVIYAAADAGALVATLSDHFTRASAVSYLVFILLYMPCLAAMFTIRQETRSWGMTGLAAFGMCAVAWVVSFVVYQGGVLLGFACRVLDDPFSFYRGRDRFSVSAGGEEESAGRSMRLRGNVM